MEMASIIIESDPLALWGLVFAIISTIIALVAAVAAIYAAVYAKAAPTKEDLTCSEMSRCWKNYKKLECNLMVRPSTTA
jgi:hypothetical protein